MSPCWSPLRSWSNPCDGETLALGLTLEATLIALFVHSLFYSGFFEDPITWFAYALAAGYLVSHDEPAEEVATIAPSPEPALT